jgi:hypothetical protein
VNPTGFDWSRIESESWNQLAANLRQVGCPEQTVGDILRARIMEAYRVKISKVAHPLAKQWSSRDEWAAIEKAQNALRGERDLVLKQHRIPPEVLAQSGFPLNVQLRIAEAEERFPKVTVSTFSTPEDVERYRSSRRSRVAFLQPYMSPEDWWRYRLTMDGSPELIAQMLGPIQASDDEFRRVFLALDPECLDRTNGLLRACLCYRSALSADTWGHRAKTARFRQGLNSRRNFCRCRRLPRSLRLSRWTRGTSRGTRWNRRTTPPTWRIFALSDVLKRPSSASCVRISWRRWPLRRPRGRSLWLRCMGRCGVPS